jgi:cytochrome P450
MWRCSCTAFTTTTASGATRTLYDPSRFLKENLDPQQRRAQMPYGAGKRMCIASGFANMEVALVVATLAQRFELDLVPGQRLRRELTFTGGPDGKLMMLPRRRAT